MWYQVGRKSELLSTNAALIWLLSSVCPFMSHQVTRFTKRLATDVTLIWLLSSVCPFMPNQVGSLTKRLATNATLILLLSSVRSLMLQQVGRVIKCLATNAALIWLLSSVRPFMYSQVGNVFKCLATNTTLIWLLSSVHPLMCHKLGRVFEYLAITVTLVRLLSSLCWLELMCMPTECLARYTTLIRLLSSVRLCSGQVTGLTKCLVVWLERAARRTRILEPTFTVFTPDELNIIVQIFLAVLRPRCGCSTFPPRTLWRCIAIDLIWSWAYVWRTFLWAFCFCHPHSFLQSLPLCRSPGSHIFLFLAKITFSFRLTKFISKFSHRWHCRSFGSNWNLASRVRCPIWVGVVRIRFGDLLLFPLWMLAYLLESFVKCGHVELTNTVLVWLDVLQTFNIQRGKCSVQAYRDCVGLPEPRAYSPFHATFNILEHSAVQCSIKNGINSMKVGPRWYSWYSCSTGLSQPDALSRVGPTSCFDSTLERVLRSTLEHSLEPLAWTIQTFAVERVEKPVY